MADEYRAKGYTVLKEEPIGKYRADLLAQKDDEKIVFEVKVGRLLPQQREKIIEIGNYVKERGNYKFLVVVATPPKEKIIELKRLEKILFDYFFSNFPHELDELSTHTKIEEVSDIEIDEIYIIEDFQIKARGSGVVSVFCQYGSDGDVKRDDGLDFMDNYPFDFDIILEYDDNNRLAICEINKLKIDTSEFYA